VVPTANFLAKLPNAVKVIAYLGTSAHGLVVSENSPLKSLTDFKGKSIAVAFGTDSHADLLASLQEAGLNPQTDLKLVNVPPIEQPATLEQKLTDGVVLRQPLLYKYDHKGAREIQRWPHQLWVIARSEFLTQNPDAERRVNSAIRQAVFFVIKNPRQSAEWFAQTLRQDPALVEAVAAENPLFTNVTKLEDISLQSPPELRAFAAKRADELVQFGLSKTVATFVYP
jgi:sulfonate transport system substrate-binding protein